MRGAYSVAQILDEAADRAHALMGTPLSVFVDAAVEAANTPWLGEEVYRAIHALDLEVGIGETEAKASETLRAAARLFVWRESSLALMGEALSAETKAFVREHRLPPRRKEVEAAITVATPNESFVAICILKQMLEVCDE